MLARRFLFLLRRPPQSGARVRETLDMILTTAAFEQPVTVLFLDDGVYSLKRGQDTRAAGLPAIAPAFETLALYDVQAIRVEQESLAERGLALTDLAIAAEPIARTDIAGLIAAHDIVVNG